MEFDRAGFDREVGFRLQRARKSKGMTQEEVARRIGLPRPSYANLESGRQRIPVDVLWRAAVVLGESIAALVPEPLTQRAANAAITSVLSFPTFNMATLSSGYAARPSTTPGEAKLIDFAAQRRALTGNLNDE